MLALTSAVCLAVATILIRQGLRGSTPVTGFWINLVVGAVGLWLGVLLSGGLGRVSMAGLVLFSLAGLVGTLGGRLLRFISIERVGASISAALINLAPFISTGLAIILLGEDVTMPILLGTIVIVGGTALLSVGGQRIGLRPALLVIPILSATCFGAVAILRKLGLGGAGPITGTAINVTAALIAFTVFLIVSRQREVMICRGRSLAYFVGAGLVENAGVFLSVVALNLGTVSVVVPLSGTAPVFVLALTLVFLRGIETLSVRIVLGSLLIVLGVYLVAGV